MKTRVKYLGRHLMIKGDYADLILRELKRATIRLGIIKPRYDEVIIHSGGRPIAKVHIKNIRHKRVKELTDEDAQLDGFKDREELLRNLRKVYGKIDDNDIVTIIEYEVVQRLDHLPVEDPYLGLEPADIARIALRYLTNQLTENEKKILLDLTRTNSIRKTAINIFGTLNKRYIIRKVLRRAIDILKKKGILGGEP